jgi:hypothetical protein
MTLDSRREPVDLREAAALVKSAALLLLGVAQMAREARHVYRALGSPRLKRRPTRKNVTTLKAITLYRPVGRKELDLIAEAGFHGFPPRLPEQPIFYPVLNEEYATQIARDWNTRDPFSGHVGYVTRFLVRADFLAGYEVKTVGGAQHQEYWIPAADLFAFNAALLGPIEVIAEFR